MKAFLVLLTYVRPNSYEGWKDYVVFDRKEDAVEWAKGYVADPHIQDLASARVIEAEFPGDEIALPK